ncbi:hypothetical protein AVEN_146765-1 [Araneus ventricosus]|uniref:BPTI/Kunitz inhibitor domain-containing protein n=1 Tax=Araneus ventricosus TaxID=182803 RepID=A0A4Y2D8L5_ARAVE|nr:hypothetical protein AVEN_146765-1 [Araneus ventricosus]
MKSVIFLCLILSLFATVNCRGWTPYRYNACKSHPDEGPCLASIKKWYYDDYRKDCRRFVYGGCKGNDNKFDSYKECMDECEGA